MRPNAGALSRALARVVLAGLIASLAAGTARSEESMIGQPFRSTMPVLAHRAVVSKLQKRERPASAPVKLRLGHLFEDVPEVVLTEIRKIEGEWFAVRKVWGAEELFRKGDAINDARIVEISKDRVVCEFRQRSWQVTPKPPPPDIVCTDISRRGEDWLVRLQIGGDTDEFRKGDEVKGAQLVEVFPTRIECQYYGIKGVFHLRRPFPAIQCVVSQITADGGIVYVQQPGGPVPIRVGQAFQDATLVSVDPDGATFEFFGTKQRFSSAEAPHLLVVGFNQVGAERCAILRHNGRDHTVKAGETIELEGEKIFIEIVEAARVQIRFREVPFLVDRR